MAKVKEFKTLTDQGNSVGEVVAVDRFLVTLRGLDDAPIGGVVLFDDGNLGMVKEAREETTLILTITSESIYVGQLAVFKEGSVRVGVGEGLLGNAVNPLGYSLERNQLINYAGEWEVFNESPTIMEKVGLNKQLPTGVPSVDTLLTVINGQRIAVMGDGKTGKTTLVNQMVASQKDTDKIVIYTLIGKKKNELEDVLRFFQNQGMSKNIIVVATNIMDPLPATYLAPYSACAIAEYFWYQGRDCMVVYDDLTSHAKAYREMALLLKMNPGRDSYSSDIFYRHSSLLERAGKLKSNNKTLTAIPLVVTPNNDMTGYISTNIISITDGQIFLDGDLFNEGMRPAVNIGLSVSRLAEKGQTSAQKKLAGKVAKALVDYKEAKQFAQFGSQDSPNIQRSLSVGQQLHALFQQGPEELIDVNEQQVILQAIILNNGEKELDIPVMKNKVKSLVAQGQEVNAVNQAKKLLNSLQEPQQQNTQKKQQDTQQQAQNKQNIQQS